MTGKQHVTIGGAVAFAGTYLYLGGNFSPSNIANIATPIIIGSIIGSYMPDVDSSKSKASQIVNKIFTVFIAAMLMGSYFKLDFLNQIVKGSTNSILTNFWLTLFVVLVILGKLSPHRQFTHKWFGTLLFCIISFLCFNGFTAVGFIVGYLAHLGADKFTKAGKNMNFLEFKLPLQNSKGKLSCHW